MLKIQVKSQDDDEMPLLSYNEMVRHEGVYRLHETSFGPWFVVKFIAESGTKVAAVYQDGSVGKAHGYRDDLFVPSKPVTLTLSNETH